MKVPEVKKRRSGLAQSLRGLRRAGVKLTEMKLRPATLTTLAEMICGAHGQSDKFRWEAFPYRTGAEIGKFFKNCGVQNASLNGTRLGAVEAWLEELSDQTCSDNTTPSDVIKEIIRELLHPRYFRDASTDRTQAFKDVNEVLAYEGFGVRSLDSGQVQFGVVKRRTAPKVSHPPSSAATTAAPAPVPAATRPQASPAQVRRAAYQPILERYDNLAATDPDRYQARGYGLEQILQQVLEVCDIRAEQPFRRNSGGEQIDGAFQLANDLHFLVECKWTKPRCDHNCLDSLNGKLARSGSGVMGLFLAINGVTENAVALLKQNPSKSIILMDGFCLCKMLEEGVDFAELVRDKRSYLSFYSEPMLSWAKFEERRKA